MNTYFERKLSYAGLSSAQSEDLQQQISLCANQQSKSGATIRLKIKSPYHTIAIRDALVGTLYTLRRGFRYRPSQEVTENASLAASFEALGQSYDEDTACSDHIELLQFIEQMREAGHDPDAFIQPDASMTITDDGLLWEVFDKKGGSAISLFLKASSYEVIGEKKNGTVEVETSLALLNSLNTIRQGELEIYVGPKPTLSKGYAGAHQKTERIPSWWLRTYLQLQGFSAEESAQVTLGRMDAYNLLRYLRLNKKDSNNADVRRSLVFNLTPGQQPEVGVDPFGVRFVGAAEDGLFNGERSIQLRTWETDAVWIFEPLFPILKRFRVQVMGTAMPIMWLADCDFLCLTLHQVGFKSTNWGKNIEMDMRVPRHTSVPAGYESYMNGAETEDRRVLQVALQQDALYSNPLIKQKIRRSQFTQFDLSQIVYRDGPEQEAYNIVGPDIETCAQAIGIDSKIMSWATTLIEESVANIQQYGLLEQNLIELDTAINSAVDKVSAKLGMDTARGRRLIGLCAQVVNTVCDTVSVERSTADDLLKVHTVAAWKNRGLHQRLAEDLKDTLFGVESIRPEEQVMGMFEHIQNEAGFGPKETKNMLKSNLGLSLVGQSQFDAVEIQKAIRKLRRNALGVLEKVEPSMDTSNAKALVQKCLSGEKSGHPVLDELFKTKRVTLLTSIDNVGTITFLNCSIREENHTSNDEVYTPTFTYHPDRGIRKVNCSCTPFKNTRVPCAHLKAVWLQYCRLEQARIEAVELDPSLNRHQKVTYIQSTKSGERLHHVKLNHLKVQLVSNGRTTTRLFNDMAAAQQAYRQQAFRFESKKYLKAGE